MSRGLHRRRRPHPDRPVRRRARRRAPRRPGRVRASRRWSRATRTSTRPRSTTSSSATPTAPARTTATSPAWPCCSPACPPGARRHRQPAVRLGHGGRRSQAARAIAVGDARSCIAGGVESMSRAPWVLLKPERGFPRGHETLHSTTLGWRMINPRMPDAVDRLAGRGRRAPRRRYEHHPRGAGRLRAAQPPAGGRGLGAGRIRRRGRAPSPGVEPRRATSRIRARLLAGGARPAAARCSARTARSRRATPRRSTTAPPRCCWPTRRAPRRSAASRWRASPRAPSTRRRAAAVRHRPGRGGHRALARAGIGCDDLAAVELNEAFAAQSLACLADWPELDPAIVNPTAAPSPSATRWAAPARACSTRWRWRAAPARRRLRPRRHVHRRGPGHRDRPRA